MNDQPAPKGVNLLKELLFDRETQRLDELTRLITAQRDAAVVRDKAVGDRLDAVFEQAGTQERLLHSVAGIIDGALREAEVIRHEPLSAAIAPLVVRTIKIQLRESQDEMVDALYPITGRLVKAYVQSAINDMMLEINAKLGGGRPAKLADQSADTGMSMAELALADANKLRVEELFLVRRGSGELVAHWDVPEPGAASDAPDKRRGSNRDTLIAGYLSGITSYSEEAFGAALGSFRTIAQENGDRIFVRGSAAHLLAVRCSGSASTPVEHVIDEVFLDTLEQYQKVLAADNLQRQLPAGGGSAQQRAAGRQDTEKAVQAILPDIAGSIEKRTTERQAALAKAQAKAQADNRAAVVAGPNFGRLYMMGGVVAAPFVAWGLWWAYQTFETTRTESAAKRVLATTDEIQGVPPKIDVEWGGRALTLSGFVPTAALRDQIVGRLAQDVPQAKIRNQLGVLPSGSGQAEIAIADLKRDWDRQRTEMATSTLQRSLQRVESRLLPLQREIAQIAPAADAAVRPSVADLERLVTEAVQMAATAKRAIDTDGGRTAETGRIMGALAAKIGAADRQLAILLGSRASGAAAADAPAGPLDAVIQAEEAALASERLNAAGHGLAQAVATRALPQRVGGLDTQVAALGEKIERLRAPTARDAFESLVRSSAIFFENNADFKDIPQADATLDQLVTALRQSPDLVVRVVGYTDERGGQAINSGLAQSRADRVAGLLIERGVATRQVVAIGRQIAKDLTRTVGAGSVNRRVEFEVGFPGETGGAR